MTIGEECLLTNDVLAAVNLCVPLYLLLCVIGSFLASGTAIPAAEAIGEGEMEEG